MLPLGRKNARKCSECDITCHANCAHLVPDFCGMSMETANELLRNWRDINRARGDKAQVRPPPRQQYTEQIHTTSPSLDSTIGAVDRLKISGPEMGPPSADAYGRPASVPPPSDRYPPDPRYYQQQQPPPQVPPPQQYQQQPPQIPPFGQQPTRPPPGARVPIPPGYPQDPMQGRSQSPYDVGPPVPGGDAGYPGGGYAVC